MRAPLAEWLNPRVEFSYGNKRWPILFDHRALLLCESLTGVDMLAANLGLPSAKFLRALLFVALDRAGSGLSLSEVGEMLRPSSLARIRRVIVQGWEASMAPPKTATAPEGDTPPKRLTWLEAWAAATSRDGLGLTDEQWLEMTPRQLSALKQVRLERLQHEELLNGILAATIANHSMNRPKKPVSATAYMIHPLPDAPQVPITGEYIMAQMAKARKG